MGHTRGGSRAFFRHTSVCSLWYGGSSSAPSGKTLNIPSDPRSIGTDPSGIRCTGYRVAQCTRADGWLRIWREPLQVAGHEGFQGTGLNYSRDAFRLGQSREKPNTGFMMAAHMFSDGVTCAVLTLLTKLRAEASTCRSILTRTSPKAALIATQQQRHRCVTIPAVTRALTGPATAPALPDRMLRKREMALATTYCPTRSRQQYRRR